MFPVFKIYKIDGSVIYSENNKTLGSINVNTVDLPKGPCFYNLKLDDVLFSGKLMKIE